MNHAIHVLQIIIDLAHIKMPRGRTKGEVYEAYGPRPKTIKMIKAMCYGASNQQVARDYGVTKQRADQIRRRYNVCAPVPLTDRCGRNRTPGTGTYARYKNRPDYIPQGPVPVGAPPHRGRGVRTEFPGIMRSLAVGHCAVVVRSEMPTESAMHALAARNGLRLRMRMVDDQHLRITRVE